MIIPVFFDDTIALIRNYNSFKKSGDTAVYLSDGKVTYSLLSPATLRKRYNNLFKNSERGI